MSLCPCGSTLPFASCCEPALDGARPATTAEALMRSRYTAHARSAHAYLKKTHAPPKGSRQSTRESGTTWTRLEIVDSSAGTETDETGVVEFRAHFKTAAGVVGVHHERSRFRRIDGQWAYIDGDLVAPAPIRSEAKTGRNDPCPCGSGKKFKRCCGP